MSKFENSACGPVEGGEAAPPSDRAATVVLQVGPAWDETGGMATVCRQMVEPESTGPFRIIHFATTRGTEGKESFFARIGRHVQHVRKLRECIRLHGARVVHIHTCSGFSFFRSAIDAWAARREGCRVVLHIHGAGFDRFCAEASGLSRWIIRQILERTDAVIALSRGWAETLRGAAPRANVVVVENAVPDVPSREAGNASPTCHFLLLARMDTWKGVDDLLAACAILKGLQTDFQVTLAGPPGEGESAATLVDRIAASGLENCVRFVGPVQGDAKEILWRQTDVLVQPSHQEGMPMSMLEALMRGIPVVATRVGAIPEVITAGREGLLVRPRAVDELAAAMLKMVNDSQGRREMGVMARQLAQHRFSLARFERDLGALYASFMRDPAQPHPVGQGHVAVSPAPYGTFRITAVSV